jgi:hypothetical protein
VFKIVPAFDLPEKFFDHPEITRYPMPAAPPIQTDGLRAVSVFVPPPRWKVLWFNTILPWMMTYKRATAYIVLALLCLPFAKPIIGAFFAGILLITGSTLALVVLFVLFFPIIIALMVFAALFKYLRSK